MGKFTRIPADTFEQIQTDAGILLSKFDPENPDDVSDEDIICPTTGGITAAAEPTYSDMGEDVDNCPPICWNSSIWTAGTAISTSLLWAHRRNPSVLRWALRMWTAMTRRTSSRA